MFRNFRKEVEATRRDISGAMQATMPSKEFGATVTLAMIHLGLTETEICKTTNLNERREKINEFNRQRNAIEKGIQALRKSSRESSKESGERHKKAMP